LQKHAPMPTTPEPPPTDLRLILDTTVLSNFALVGQIALLQRLYTGQAGTTLAVADEIRRGLSSGYEYLRAAEEALLPLSSTGWLSVLTPVSPEEQRLFVELGASLAPGEASCLALAIARGLTLASDDRAARQRAAERGVRLTGTLGILVRAVREGHIALAEANDALARMIALRYRSPVLRLDELI
jgi:predicted nucleic acid-binding protein